MRAVRSAALRASGSAHVHLLVRRPARLAVGELAKQVKGASSHLPNQHRPEHAPFHWQGGYAAFSVSFDAVETVARYVRGQAARHRAGTLRTVSERPLYPARGYDPST